VQEGDEPQGLLAVVGLADHLHVGPGTEDIPDRLAHEARVVNQQYSNFIAHTLFFYAAKAAGLAATLLGATLLARQFRP
jgi:hypothetical protein